MTKHKFVIIGLVMVLLVGGFGCFKLFWPDLRQKPDLFEPRPESPKVSDQIISENNDLAEKIKQTIDQVNMFGIDQTTITKKLGKSEKIFNEKFFTNLYYDGLYIQIYRTDSFQQVRFLSISNNKYQNELELNVGTSREQLTDVLGEPAEIINDEYIYSIEAVTGTNYVCFYLNNDIIYQIDWEIALK